jgi:hypothetical protein
MDLRIPGSEINSVSKTYKSATAKTSKTATGKSAATETADSVVLSPDAEQTLNITKAAEAKAKDCRTSGTRSCSRFRHRSEMVSTRSNLKKWPPACWPN